MPTAEAHRLRLVLENREGQARLSPQLVAELVSALQAADRYHVVTIENSSAVFCEGLDLDLAADDAGPPDRLPTDAAGLDMFATLVTTIERTPRPIVALVRGSALGGGVGLAAAADLVLADASATFSLPETLMGLIPAIVFPVVARRIGVPRTRLLALSGIAISAHEAQRIGLVDEVVDDLESAYRRYARRFARMDRRALAAVKALAAQHFGSPPGYQADAIASFKNLIASSETRDRLRRYAAGDIPWQEHDAS